MNVRGILQSLVVTTLLFVVVVPEAIAQSRDPTERRFLLGESRRSRVIPARSFKIHDQFYDQSSVDPVGFMVLANDDGCDDDATSSDTCNRTIRFLKLRYYKTRDEPGDLIITVPDWGKLQKKLDLPFWQGLISINDLTMCFFPSTGPKYYHLRSGTNTAKSGESACDGVAKGIAGYEEAPEILGDLQVSLTNKDSAFISGLVALLLMWFVVWLTSMIRAQGYVNPFRALAEVFRGVDGEYSLSKLQMLIWTAVVGFGLVFVWRMEGRFLDISNNVLYLLGIGGLTLTGKKFSTLHMVKASGNPKLVVKSPSVGNLLCIDHRPDLSRFQMLLFTLLIASSVVSELLDYGKFPDISSGLVGLMGISSATYLAVSHLQGTTKPPDKPDDPPEEAGNDSNDDNRDDQ